MVPEADNGNRDDGKHTSKPHGAVKGSLSPFENPVGDDALGKESSQECKASGDSHFGQHVQVHVVCMENQYIVILYKEIVIRVCEEVRSPADARKRMFFNHGSRAFPESEAEIDGRIVPSEKGKETFSNLSVIKEKADRNEQEQKPESLIMENGKACHDASGSHPRASGIGKRQAGKEHQQDEPENVLPPPLLLIEEERGKSTDDHQKVSAQKVRVLQRRIHAAAEKRETLQIDPALRCKILCHVMGIRILEETVSGHTESACQEGIERLFLFPDRMDRGKDHEVDGRIKKRLERPVENREEAVLGYGRGQKRTR